MDQLIVVAWIALYYLVTYYSHLLCSHLYHLKVSFIYCYIYIICYYIIEPPTSVVIPTVDSYSYFGSPSLAHTPSQDSSSSSIAIDFVDELKEGRTKKIQEKCNQLEIVIKLYVT